MTTFWMLAGMAVLTFLIRASFLVFGRGLRFPAWLHEALHYVPPAVLSALVVPMALAPRGTLDIGWDNAYLAGTLAAGLVALRSRHTLLAIVAGFVVYVLWRLVFAG